MYCKDCAHRDKDRTCRCDKINENESTFIANDRANTDDELRYSYHEGGWFEAGDNFGCVHFKQK